MRINNNIAALNTYRQIGIIQGACAKSMERLSSGFRINRAGDDAAGLAISEKMRGQIRGLQMASRNAQDAISLIQTAEGALNETHSILQRMRELAVQAANDTNTENDRLEIQYEITQLKAELDRIGNTTEFNTKKLLDGSAQGIAGETPGALRINNNSGIAISSEDRKAMLESIAKDSSWAFDGAYMIVKINQTKNNGVNIYNANDFKLIGPNGKEYDFIEIEKDTAADASNLKAGTIIADGGREFVCGGSGDTGPVTVSDAIGSEFQGGSAALAANGFVLGQAVNHTVISSLGSSSTLASGSSVTIRSGQTVELGSAGGAYGITYTSNGELQLLGSSGNVLTTIEVGGSVTLDNGTVIRNDGGGKFSVTSGSLALGSAGLAAGAGGNVSAFELASQSILGSASVIANPSSTTLVQAVNYTMSDAGAFNVNVTVGNSAHLNQNEITSMKAGTVLARGSDISVSADSFITLNVNGKEIEVSWDGGIMKVGDQILAAGKSITLADGTVLTHSTNLGSPAATGKITVTGGKVTLAKDINSTNASAWNIAKDSTIAAGSKVAANTNLMAGTVLTDSNTFFSGSVTLAHGGKGVQFSANAGSGIAADYSRTKVGESMTFVFKMHEAALNSIDNSIMIQIGANSGQNIFIPIGDMRAKALGVDGIDVSTRWGAATAMETIDNAIQSVSRQRSTLGAMQNRLEYTIRNLDTAAENLQAAESRIRDADMAKEIMEYTKNSILLQVAQAMLAQANQAPQSILQLLQF